jgi:hypothetical protein
MERLGDPDPGQSWELGTEARLFADERGRSRVELKVLFGQEGRSIATCTSAYLAPQARSGPRITEGAALSPGAPEGESTGLELDLSGSAGRSYARLSCDWNPIHLWQLTARLFGLKQPIIHGMYLLALAERHAQEQFGQPITHLAGTFARPVGLPGRIRLSLGAPAPDGTEFQIRDIRADRLAVTGSLRI